MNTQATSPQGVAPNRAAPRGFVSPAFSLVLITATLAGCASLPKPSPEWSERHPVDTSNTLWARSLAPSAEPPGFSAIGLLRYGHDALSARLALADTAESCLDLQ